jgi:hypothetical protein
MLRSSTCHCMLWNLKLAYHVNNSSLFDCIQRRMSQVYIFKLYFLLNILVLSFDNKVWKVFHQDFWLNFTCSFSPYMLFASPTSSCSDLIIGEQSRCKAPIFQLSPSKYSHTTSCHTAFILWCTKRNSPLYMAYKLKLLCLETVRITMRLTAFI